MQIIISKIKLIICSLLMTSCSLIDITPEHVVPPEIAFSDVESYQNALNDVYRTLTGSIMNMQSTDFASDDFTNVIHGYNSVNYYIHYWDYKSQPEPYVWVYQYQLISQQNVVINNYDLVPELSEEEIKLKKQIYAQALAMRSWSLFNVAQLYAPRYDMTNGDVPAIPLKLKLELEYLPKSTLSDVYTQIFTDLDLAQDLLKETDYTPSSSKKLYEFNLEAMLALEARIALFIGDYDRAQKASEHFINIPLLEIADYDMLWSDIFDSRNQEIIFMTHDLSDTDDADLIDYYEIYDGNNAVIVENLIHSFTTNDVRKGSAYINTDRHPSKYIIEAENDGQKDDRNLHYKHFRLAEQYLIYAESILEENPAEALRVVNLLREKRGADLFSGTIDKQTILAERRRELFAEGLRFYDLKRLASELNIVVERSNGKVLNPNSELYNWNIPLAEINSNPNIND